MTEKFYKNQIEGNIVNSITGPQVDNSDPENPILPEFQLPDGSNSVGGSWWIDQILSDRLPSYKQVLTVLNNNTIEYGNPELQQHRFIVEDKDGIKIVTGGNTGIIWNSLNLTNVSQLNNDAGYLQSNDLDGFVYNVTYTSNNHVLTFFRQNQPNIVVDLPIEQLITGVQLVGDDLVFTFEDGSTVTVPMNTLLVGVVKSVNGLTPNSQGEIILQITDIPGLQSALNGKVNLSGNNATGDLLEAINWRHEHANKSVLDNLTQSVINNSHTHTNKALLDTYNQTNANITDAVNKRHDAVTLGTNTNGLSLFGQVLSLVLATSLSAGAMSPAQFSKLDGIAPNANNYVLPTASTTILGGVKVGSGLSIDANGVLANTAQNVTQVLGGSGNTISLSGGGGSYTVPYTDWANIPNKPTTFTPSAHTHPTNQITALTGYVLGTNAALSATDSLNAALGKIQAQINAKTSNTGTVTSITAGTGLSGGTINTIGTIALDAGTLASLAKADAALQSETDPTVPSWVKAITTGDITNWNNKQNALAAGNHIDITSNVISVDVNSSNYEVLDVKRNSPSAGSAVNFVNDSGKLGDVGFGVINNDFHVRGAGGSTLFRINQANNVPSFPNLPSVQTGTTGNLAYINASGEIWRHQLTIGDLITTGNIGGYIPAAQTLITNTNSVISNTGGYVGITGGNDITISSVGRNNLIDRNDLTNFGAGLFPIFNTTGSTNYPSITGAGIVSVRNSSNNAGGNFMLWTSAANSPELYFDTSGTAGWFGLRTVADRDWVTQQITTAGGNYMTTNTNQLTLTGSKLSTDWWQFAFRENSWYKDSQDAERIYFGTGTNTNGIIFKNSNANHWFQFRNTSNQSAVYITDSGLVNANTGYAISGQNNSSILLAGGGHRPVSDFALAGNLGNYVLKTGDTMTGALNFASGTGSGVIQYTSVNKLRFSARNTILSAASSNSSNGIYLRPQGDTVSTGQVLIDGNGQINTPNHGNSSQWNHEVYGLGLRGGALNIASITDQSILDSRFFRSTQSGHVGGILSLPYDGSGTGARTNLFRVHNGTAYISSTLISNGQTPVWNELYHTGNLPNIPAQVNLTQGAGISITGTYPNLTITNSAPNVQADWNATSGLAQILNKPTIPTVGNGQLSFTAPTGLNITGTFSANQSGNTTIPITWQTGYQAFTTAESTKLAGIQAGATVPNNGTFTVQGTGALTGSGSTSANASANTSATLDLNAATKSQIQQGVDADNKNQEFWMDSKPYAFINMPGSGVADEVIDNWHSTVNAYGIASSSIIQIPDHHVHGARLVIQTLNLIDVQINYRRKDQSNVGNTTMENQDKEFVWDDGIRRWREVF